MSAQIRKELNRSRAIHDERELALDLTAAEVVLYEGNAREGWRRFAGVALEDPEFLEVIDLLRSEAESEIGAAPVRIWLPAEQVLSLSARLDAKDERGRLRAAFSHASRATGHAAQDIAVALAPPDMSGATSLLVTYAATWHEARDYVARWGFVPGPVSTRHHAKAFGAAGPVFLLAPALGDPETAGRRRAAWISMAFAALVWPLAPQPAQASQAPAAAPLPPMRGAAAPPASANATPASADATGRLAAITPPPRPEGFGPSPGRAATAGEPGETVAVTVAPSDAGMGAAGALATPLPLARPARSAAPQATPGKTAPSAGAVNVPSPARRAVVAPSLQPDSAALIGVLNLDSGREALLRLPDGGFRTVRVGEVLDGWQVSAIGPDAMQIRRGSETRTLLLVSR